jgi:hypothetical protein
MRLTSVIAAFPRHAISTQNDVGEMRFTRVKCRVGRSLPQASDMLVSCAFRPTRVIVPLVVEFVMV